MSKALQERVRKDVAKMAIAAKVHAKKVGRDLTKGHLYKIRGTSMYLKEKEDGYLKGDFYMAKRYMCSFEETEERGFEVGTKDEKPTYPDHLDN